MEFWSEIGIFALQTLSVVIGIALVLILIFVLAQKAQALKYHLQIESLNEVYETYEQTLQSLSLSKKELKAKLKKLKKHSKKEDEKQKPTLYVIDFHGDIKANASEHLKEEISAVLTAAKKGDEVLIKIESPGGVVHGYGYCASQLRRLREASISTTVCVDKVAASGGYMMACVADKIIAAPFAIIGSVGVLAQVPNFNKLLKKHDIEYKEYTAGDYKKTVSLLGEITSKGEEKFKQQMEETHLLFKQFVSENRPQVEIDKVATGEYWFGSQALPLKLVDELGTSDDFLLSRRKSHNLLKLSYKTKKKLSEKFSEAVSLTIGNSLERVLTQSSERQLPF